MTAVTLRGSTTLPGLARSHSCVFGSNSFQSFSIDVVSLTVPPLLVSDLLLWLFCNDGFRFEVIQRLGIILAWSWVTIQGSFSTGGTRPVIVVNNEILVSL
jgi:hypothetical protein